MNRKDIVARLRDAEDAAQFATPIQVEAADEIERLQAKVERLTKRGLQDLHWQNDELHEENERLRELLKECRPYVESAPVCDPELCDKIEKEVSDE